MLAFFAIDFRTDAGMREVKYALSGEGLLQDSR
jgi:hypothetical protein